MKVRVAMRRALTLALSRKRARGQESRNIASTIFLLFHDHEPSTPARQVHPSRGGSSTSFPFSCATHLPL